MAKKKLLEDILRQPSRFYRVPGDVLRDRRFGDCERAEILKAWQDMHDGREAEIGAALSELEHRGSANHGVHHAAE